MGMICWRRELEKMVRELDDRLLVHEAPNAAYTYMQNYIQKQLDENTRITDVTFYCTIEHFQHQLEQGMSLSQVATTSRSLRRCRPSSTRVTTKEIPWMEIHSLPGAIDHGTRHSFLAVLR